MSVHYLHGLRLDIEEGFDNLNVYISDGETLENLDISESRLASLLNEIGHEFSHIERCSWCEMGNEYSDWGYSFEVFH